MEFLQQWWGLMGIIITAVGGVVGIVIAVKKERRINKNDKISKEFDLYTKITGYMEKELTDIRDDFASIFENNRTIAKSEKKMELLEQKTACAIHSDEIKQLEKRVCHTEQTNSVLVKGVNILVKTALKEKLNGEVQDYKDAFEGHFIK